MKKICLSILIIFMFALTGCGNADTPTGSGQNQNQDQASNTDQENYKIKIAAQNNSGHVFQYIAQEMGYLDEEKIDMELIYINNGTDAFTALTAGQVDVLSTYGTGGPLIQIANGQEYMIFGGYMIIGETPVYAKPETQWTGLDSFKGKTIAITRGGTPDIVLKGIFYDAGILDEVTFIEMKKNQETLQAVANGQADFGATATGYQLQAAALGLEVKMWPDEFWPNHSCCRMLSTVSWLNDEHNQEATYRMLRAYLRAEEYLQDHYDEAVDLVSENLDMDKATVESFVKSPHMKYDTDPFKNSVITMWDKMGNFDYITNTEIKIADHINIAIYEKALDSLIADYPDSQFFKDKKSQFTDNNF